MLAQILALAVALVSLALYMSAFFFPEVYRKSDFTWSGIGLFYALVLWVCAGRITGGVLLGQTASVALLGWLSWQTISLRRELAPQTLRTPLPGDTKTIAQAMQFKFGELRSRWQETAIARQTNRLAGTIAGWTGNLTKSVVKPKKQPPPVGGRSRPPLAVPLPQPLISEPTAAEPPAIATPTTPAATPIRPTRPGLFGGLRRNAPKPKAPKSKTPKQSAPPAISLDELDNWDEAEATLDSIEASIEAEVLEANAEAIEAAIEGAAADLEADASIEEVVVVIAADVIAADSPPVVEIIDVIEVPDSIEPEITPEMILEAIPEAPLEAAMPDEAAIDPPADQP